MLNTKSSNLKAKYDLMIHGYKKELVEAIEKVESNQDINFLFTEIETALSNNHLTYNEYNMLYLKLCESNSKAII